MQAFDNQILDQRPISDSEEVRTVSTSIVDITVSKFIRCGKKLQLFLPSPLEGTASCPLYKYFPVYPRRIDEASQMPQPTQEDSSFKRKLSKREKKAGLTCFEKLPVDVSAVYQT
jgi:hypothetical protein